MNVRLLPLACPLLLALGCAHQSRFAERAILWHDPDDRPIKKPPERHNPALNWEGARDATFRPAQHFLALDYVTEAQNVNALDEVPDSSWFQNRRRDPASPDDQPRWRKLSPDVVAHGAYDPQSDEPVAPLTVLHAKTIGSAKGLIVRDARGVQYLLKLDPPNHPGLVTSSEVVATRLAWAAGWLVPSVTLVDLHQSDLSLEPGAWTLDKWDHRLPFTAQALDDLLAPVTREGRLRALASRWIEGDILGWFSYLGRDLKDPNDRVNHEDRRDLRGFGVWSGWIDNVDTLDNNTLDSYVGQKGQGHVLHYQQDLGASFGVFANQQIPYWMGQETYFAPARILGSLVTLGALPRPWAGAKVQKAHDEMQAMWPELGFFDREHFDPKSWRPVLDNPAFARQTRRDRYWGAKQVAAFDESELRAAISAGRYRPEAAEHLFQVLWQRRAKIARAYFTEVAPLDHFRFEGAALCFEDLWLSAGLGGAQGTSYRAHLFGSSGSGARLTLGPSRPCVPLGARDGQQGVELRAKRPGDHHYGPKVRVYLVARNGTRHVIGVER